jgi:hypothetical protein
MANAFEKIREFEAFKKIRKTIIDAKIWLIRSQSWISVANTAMLGFLFLSQLGLQDATGKTDIKVALIVITVTLTFMVIWGFLDDKLGFFGEEANRSWTRGRNPHIDRIHESLERIETRLNEMEGRMSK